MAMRATTTTCQSSGRISRGNVPPVAVVKARPTQRMTQTRATAESVATTICTALIGAGLKAAVDYYMTTDKKVEDLKKDVNAMDKERAHDIYAMDKRITQDMYTMEKQIAQDINSIKNSIEVLVKAVGDINKDVCDINKDVRDIKAHLKL